MKYIIAVIQPDKLNAVLDEMERREINLVTVTEVMGHGRQRGMSLNYRGHKESGRLLRKVKLEIAVNENFVDTTIEGLRAAARTDGGEIGDGKIFVLDLQQAIRIRTGETGSEAIG